MSPSTVLLVGLGNVGMLYGLQRDRHFLGETASHATAFHRHPRFELVGGVDTDSSRRNIFAKTFDRPAFLTIDQATQAVHPDVVIVASPTRLRLEHVEDVLQHVTPKLILCEKPLAWTSSEAHRVVQACSTAGVLLRVNYQRRVNPSVIEIERRLRQGDIALPIRGVCFYTKGVLHSASHFVDLLTYWLGPTLSALTRREGRQFGTSDAEPDFSLRFPSAEVEFVALDEDNYSCHELILYAANGALRYGHAGEQVEWRPSNTCPDSQGGRSLAGASENPQALPAMDTPSSLMAVLDDIETVLRGGNGLLSSGVEATRHIEILEGVLSADASAFTA